MSQFNIYSTCSFINKVVANALDGVTTIFRGHSSDKYELKASVGRIKGYTLEKEKELFLEFKKQYRPYTRECPETDLELLFMAQHYGVPTRLLDWTFNPLIALYFATKENGNNDGKIYSINLHEAFKVEQLTDTSLSINGILCMDGCKYVVPHYTDNRYYNQKSLFLLTNMPWKKFTFADHETVYIVKSEAKSQIRKELALLGIDEPYVFPTLDNLGKSIKKACHVEMI